MALDQLAHDVSAVMGRRSPSADASEVAIEVDADLADEVSHPLVARREGVDRLIGQRGAKLDRVNPTHVVALVDDHRITIRDPSSVREL